MACIVKVPKNEQADYDYIAFSYNGYHSFEDLKIYRVSDGNRYEENISPNIESKTATVEGYNGEYLFDTFHRRKPISIKIAFDNLYEEDYQRLKKVFRGDEMGELWFAEYPFKVYDVKLASPMLLSVISFDAPDGSGRRLYKGDGTLEFVALYPYAHTPDIVQKWNGTSYVNVGAGTAISSYNDFKNKNEWQAIFTNCAPGHFVAQLVGDISGQSLGYEIILDENGNYYATCTGPINNYTDPVVGGVLSIPSAVELFGVTMPVKKITNNAFLNLNTESNKVQVVLPNTITHIGEKAFYFNKQDQITFSGGCVVTECGDNAFYDYTKLHEILSDGAKWYTLDSDGKKLVYAIPTNTNLTIPNTVEQIFPNPIKVDDGTSIESLSLPFLGSTAIDGFSITKLFNGSISKIETLIINGGVLVEGCCKDVSIGTLKLNNISIIPKQSFSGCGITKVYSGEDEDTIKATKIGPQAFEYNYFTTIKIVVNGDLKIDDRAFADTPLITFELNCSGALTIGKEILRYNGGHPNSRLQKIVLNMPEGVGFKLAKLFSTTDIYTIERGAPQSNGYFFPTSLKVLEVTGKIPDYFCKDITTLEKVTLKSAVSIGKGAFENCSGIKDLDVAGLGSNTIFGDDAFKGCSGLSHQYIVCEPSNWTTYNFQNIHANPLYNNSYLTNRKGYSLDYKEMIETSTVIRTYAFAGALIKSDSNIEFGTGTTFHANPFPKATFLCDVRMNLSKSPYFRNVSFARNVELIYNQEQQKFKKIFENCWFHGTLTIKLQKKLRDDEKLTSLFNTNDYGENIGYITEVNISIEANNVKLPSNFFENFRAEKVTIQPNGYSYLDVGKEYYKLLTNSEISSLDFGFDDGKVFVEEGCESLPRLVLHNTSDFWWLVSEGNDGYKILIFNTKPYIYQRGDFNYINTSKFDWTNTELLSFATDTNGIFLEKSENGIGATSIGLHKEHNYILEDSTDIVQSEFNAAIKKNQTSAIKKYIKQYNIYSEAKQ